jgi:hypothetical protein
VSESAGIVVTLGPCDDMRAEVFVRVMRPAVSGSQVGPAVLEGTLTGPECRRATTLPSTARLVDLGRPAGVEPTATGGLVARAVLTEPAFWTPELPNLYRLALTLRVGDEVAAVSETRVGLRRLGARGRSLRLDGRRWVPRGAMIDAGDVDAADLRERGTAAVIVNPDGAICSRADAEGVAIVALVERVDAAAESVAAIAGRIMLWALHPAVVMVLLPTGTAAAAAAAVAAAVRTVKGTLQLGWQVDGAAPPPDVPTGIEWLAVEVGRERRPHAVWRDAAPPLPLVARAADGGGRAACDSLQSELAAWGLAGGGERVPWDWAGYLVW